jgi:LuxR family maltose regulon positive regulatory protein
LPISDQILATKLLAPRTGIKLINRTRLLDKFANYRATKLTLVSAPAGYGKTVLISQFVAQFTAPVVWYQLDHFDNDLAVFIQHLLVGIDRHLPGFSTEIMGMIDTRDPEKDLRRITAAIVNGLTTALSEEMILVIDDYHTIEEDAAVHGFMDVLLDYLPDPVHLILASRTIPPLHLGRLKVAGLMEEINMVDLRFSQEEIGGFLNAEKNEPVSSQRFLFWKKKRVVGRPHCA